MSSHRPSSGQGQGLTLLAELVSRRLGLEVEGPRLEMLQMKLRPRLRQHGCHDWLDYYFLLRYHPHAETEWQAVAEALSVLESYFWREYDQIAYCVERLVPRWLERMPGRAVRIWHAGCAAGEEPYTLAIALHRAGMLDPRRVHILGTDVHRGALERARRGIYRPHALRAIPPEVRERYFRRVDEHRWALDETIRRSVRFFHLNLLDDDTMHAMRGFDAIFCRNVFIYFHAAAIRQVAGHFHRALHADGALFLGAAESLVHLSQLWVLVEEEGVFYYRRAEGGVM